LKPLPPESTQDTSIKSFNKAEREESQLKFEETLMLSIGKALEEEFTAS